MNSEARKRAQERAQERARGTRRVMKWSVPVDDRDHPIGAGPVVHVGCQAGMVDVVQVWTEEGEPDDVECLVGRRARVYGTGQPVPDGDVHLGSVIATRSLVWHVYGSPSC